MLNVIGAGFGRTGTHSLAQALEILGYGSCYTIHDMDKNPAHRNLWRDALDGRAIDWNTLYQKYRSAVEWPTVAFLPDLFRHYPKARIILTLRDPASWYASAAATIFPGLEATAHHPDPERRAKSSLKRRLILEHVFEGKYWDKAHTIQIYEKHVRDVVELVPAGRLLQYRVTEGWEPLCHFLEVPVPDAPFPHRNERTDFRSSAPAWAIRVIEENRLKRDSQSSRGQEENPQ